PRGYRSRQRCEWCLHPYRLAQVRNILALSAKIVCKTGSIPISTAIVREVKTLLRSSYHVATVIWVDAHLPDCVILWELAWRLGVNHTEHVRAEYGPSSTCITRLQNALAAHG